MRRAVDGFLSFATAILVLVVIAAPLWAAVRALLDHLVPLWIWLPVIVLGCLGGLICASFLRKSWRGVHPLREKRR